MLPTLQDFQANFGGYLLGLIVILLVYSAVEMISPQYADGLAAVTLLGVVLYIMNHPKQRQPQQQNQP